MKRKICVYVGEELVTRLAAAAGQRGATKSGLVSAALDHFLDPTGDQKGRPAMDERLAQMGQQLDQLAHPVRGIDRHGRPGLAVADQVDEVDHLLRDHVVAIHGCDGNVPQALLGGLDAGLKVLMHEAIAAAGIEARPFGHRFRAVDPRNICNRGRRGVGVQVELTSALRLQPSNDAIVAAIRSVLLTL